MKQIVFACFALLVITSCNRMRGSGNIVKEKRQTGNFKGISAGGAFTVEVRNGPNTEVVVEADDNILRMIETEVDDNVLHIDTKDGANLDDVHLVVYVTAPEINSINSSGAATIKAIDQLKSDRKISLDASGAAHLTASVDAPEIRAEVSGAGNMEVSGKTRDYNAEVDGSGHLHSGDLKSENTIVDVSGAGNAWVHASISLKADASGAGNVHYKGGANVTVNTSGAGNVRKED